MKKIILIFTDQEIFGYLIIFFIYLYFLSALTFLRKYITSDLLVHTWTILFDEIIIYLLLKENNMKLRFLFFYRAKQR